MEFILKWLSVFALSSVKMLLGGMPLAISYSFTPLEAFSATALGSITGCFFFVYCGNWVLKRWEGRKGHIKKPLLAKKIKSLRKFIRIRNKYGMPGIAILTPAVLSIPVGCLLAVRFYHHPTIVLRWLIPSCLLWCALLSFAHQLIYSLF